MVTFPSQIGMGSFQFREAVPGSDALRVAAEVWRAAWEHGVRHIDTAQSYGNGVSEAAVGEIVRGYDDAFVATKIHYKASADEVVAAVEQSRSRLGHDVIDLVYLHWPRRGQALRPVMEGFARCRDKGWIRHAGASNFSVVELEEASRVCPIDAYQIGYSLLWRYPERDVIPWCREHGVAVITYSALAQGLLAGKIRDRSQIPADDPRLKTLYYDEGVFERIRPAVEAMVQAAAGAREPLARLALDWVLSRPGVSATLLGASSARQIVETLPEGYPHDAAAAARALRELTRLSDEVAPFIPDIGNIFKHYP